MPPPPSPPPPPARGFDPFDELIRGRGNPRSSPGPSDLPFRTRLRRAVLRWTSQKPSLRQPRDAHVFEPAFEASGGGVYLLPFLAFFADGFTGRVLEENCKRFLRL